MDSPLFKSAVVVLDSDSERRQHSARLLYDEAWHVEPYECVDELQGFWPNADIIIVHDDGQTIQSIFEFMLEQGCWYPVIAYAADPELSRVVDVILMGALDYLRLPTTREELRERLVLVSNRQRSISEVRSKAAHCQRLVEKLTLRERDVLFRLAKGASNKKIARELQISPRTIEVHRANMMGKLGVSHVGEAVSIAFHAGMTETADQN